MKVKKTSLKQTYEYKTLHSLKAEKAVQVLVKQINIIKHVKDWASETEISESSLHRIVAEGFDKTPGDILKEVRYEKVIRILKRDAEAGAYCVALDAGFSSEAAMRMFLKRRYGTNIRTLRRGILSGELRMEWVWLNGRE